MTREEYKSAVKQAKEHILSGDIFQIVLSQRFERRTFADPFEVYRALRVVNPSPYMTYLQVCTQSIKICPTVSCILQFPNLILTFELNLYQARGSILVSSSPEILTCVKKASHCLVLLTTFILDTINVIIDSSRLCFFSRDVKMMFIVVIIFLTFSSIIDRKKLLIDHLLGQLEEGGLLRKTRS